MDRNIRIAKQLVRIARNLIVNPGNVDVTMQLNVFRYINGIEEPTPFKTISYTLGRDIMEEYLDSYQYKGLRERRQYETKTGYTIDPRDFVDYVFSGRYDDKKAQEIFSKTGLANGGQYGPAYETSGDTHKSFFVNGGGMKMLDENTHQPVCIIRCSNEAQVLRESKIGLFSLLEAARDSYKIENMHNDQLDEIRKKVEGMGGIMERLEYKDSKNGKGMLTSLKQRREPGYENRLVAKIAGEIVPNNPSYSMDDAFYFKFTATFHYSRQEISVDTKYGFITPSDEQVKMISDGNAKIIENSQDFYTDCDPEAIVKFVMDEYEKASNVLQNSFDILKSKYNYCFIPIP